MMERLTRAEAIRAKCLDCMYDQTAEVRLCPSTDCPLWRYRMGYEIGDDKVTKNKKGEKSE